MKLQCAIIPKVKNKNGELVDSRLFKGLLSLTTRESARDIYLKTKSSDFINNWNSKLNLDENGEPTISSLMYKAGLNKIIAESNVLTKLNKDIGYFKKGSDRVSLNINNQENYNKFKQKAIEFNTTSDYRDNFVASVVKVQDSETGEIYIAPKVEKRNAYNSLNASNMSHNEALNTRLREILESKNISIGALNDLEKRLNINGVTDFDLAKTSADGIIQLIRIAEGEAGEKALPEEFSHFAIEALGDNPLVNRLINSIIDNNLINEILGDSYEDYSIMYNDSPLDMAKEAAGKLVAKHLLDVSNIPNKPYKSILTRLINVIKDFFSNIGTTDIQKAVLNTNSIANSIADGLLNGDLSNSLDLKNIKVTNRLYQLSERAGKTRDLLKSIQSNELKRLSIYSTRNNNAKFTLHQREVINNITESIENNEIINGISEFTKNALDELQKVNSRLNSMLAGSSNNDSKSINEKAGVLRDIRNYMSSFEPIFKDIRKSVLEESRFDDNQYSSELKEVLDAATSLLDDLSITYNEVAMPLFVSFIKPFVGDGITITFGKYKGTTMTAEDIVKKANKDISFFDLWMDSMADSTDYMLKIMDQAVKKSKENARLDTIDVVKELQSAMMTLEQSGIKDTEWMFERDAEGNLTGKYISEIDYSLYKKKYEEMTQGLHDKYPSISDPNEEKEAKRERKKWFAENFETIDGVHRPKISIYSSEAFKKLTPAQREFYDKFMKIKKSLDSYLPNAKLLNTVKIRKDLVERVKGSDGLKSGTKQIWESIKDSFIRRADDTDFGYKHATKDFSGNEVMSLPIYYTNLKDGESNNDISTDAVSTLTAYAAMANDYNQMNKILDTLELGRDLLRERKILQTSGGKTLKERFKVFGTKVESPITISGDKTKFMKRLNSFFNMQVYGRYIADEGTFGDSRIDKAKTADTFNRLTSVNTLALNILSGISNVATGTIMMRIESLAGEYYNESNTLHADRNYGSALPEYLAEIGNRVKVGKLALWDELFNVMQEYETEIKEMNYDRKTWFTRMFGSSALFMMSNAGEHWMQNRTSLALADRYKMKSPEGKLVSLWDAMEVVYTDPNNKKLGAKLQVKDGYTKEDGSKFTRDDIIAFSRKTTAINERMHGVYNKADRSAMQQFAVGRMAIMFRKWVKSSLNRRFQEATYNMDLQEWTEGYYKTAGRFMLQLAKDLKQSQFDIGSSWSELTNTEKANIKRSIVEVAHYLMIVAALGLIDWDTKNSTWAGKMAEYQLRRLQNEIGVLVPGKPMIDEGLKLVKSPAAAIQTIQSTLDLLNVINPYNYEAIGGKNAIMQSGVFKGHNKAYKYLMRSPLAPMRNTVTRGIAPELAIPYFKQ